MSKLKDNQEVTLVANKNLFNINKHTLKAETIRCHSCNSKLLNLLIDNNSQVIECKCRKCKNLNYYKVK